MPLWYAPQATAKIGASLTSVSSASSLFAQVTAAGPGDFTGKVKDLRIRGGDMDVEVLNTLGATQLRDERRPTIVEVEFTLTFNQGTEWRGQQETTSLSAPAGFTRIQMKDNTGARTKKAVVFKITDGTLENNILLNNALVTRVEKSLSAEGHMEETVTMKGVVSDYYEEFK